MEWFKKFNVTPNNYYLVVGRFVPENNYETIIREFMASTTSKDLVLITNVETNKFYKYLLKKLNFMNDTRIKFAGTVYDEQLLKKIRENAYGYIHGHSVGGTNPSLLEALASTKLNLLFDVGFNKECGGNSCFYWNNKQNNLCMLIEKSEMLSENDISNLNLKSIQEVYERYDWGKIVKTYECEFEQK